MGIRARFNYRGETIIGAILVLIGMGFLSEVRFIPALVWLYTGLFLIPRTRPIVSGGLFKNRHAGFLAGIVFFFLFLIATAISV